MRAGKRSGRCVVVGVVPVRYESRRWPGKALAEVSGQPLAAWAWEALSAVPELARAVIATDDERIARWAEAAGAPYLMTSPECRNGTERVAEVAERDDRHGERAEVYVNVQADQVSLEPRVISRLVIACRRHPEWRMATLATRVSVRQARRSADGVLVVANRDNLARRFYRGGVSAPVEPQALRHIGVYAYRRAALREYRQAEPSAEETAQHLEQLRGLALGWKIGVVRVRSRAQSCDRPSDAT